MSFKPYLAEMLGAFTLTLVVSFGLATPAADAVLPVPVLAGITLGLFVYTVGWVSGAHLNPAVTVALATLKKVSIADAVYYVLAQFVGALVASFAAWQLTGGWVALNPGPNTALVTIAEALGAFALVWGIMAVVEGKVSKGASGLVIGSSLSLGIVIALGAGSNGVLNPAVALGIHSFASAYLIGPVVGGIAAAWAYRALAEPSHARHEQPAQA